jgi:TRAP-type C4-dicarboxylate transport system permease small subunit
MERFFAGIERVLLPLLAAMLAFITAGVFIQVLLRYFFAQSFLWGEELSLFAFIWSVMLGTAVCSWRRQHFAFDVFSTHLHGRAAGVHRLIVDAAMLIVTLVLVIEGWRFSILSLQRLSPALGITLFIPTIVIPVAGALMTLVCLVDIARDCRRIWTGEPH